MQRVDLPLTRKTPTTKTSIDYICSTLLKDDMTTDVIDTGISDHTGQSYTIIHDVDSLTQSVTSKRIDMSTRKLLRKLILGQKD